VQLKSQLAFILVLAVSIKAYPRQQWEMKQVPVQSRWAREVSPENALTAYPRPQMVRTGWRNLNGLWEYAITGKDAVVPGVFDGNILVPFAVESALSGVKKSITPKQNLWYKRRFEKPLTQPGYRVLLHFGAVDWEATVYINNKNLGEHRGGYQNFSLDITDALHPGQNELVVKVYDPTDQGPNPHGKQVLKPENIYYTASTGIWQTVWMETVPEVYIRNLKLDPQVDEGLLFLSPEIGGDINKPGAGYLIEAIVSSKGKLISRLKRKLSAEFRLEVPDARLWSPSDPFLYDLVVRLYSGGKIVDSVASYFGMRKIEIKKDSLGFDRIFLNGKYTYNLGTLDQGFWPEGLMTAATDEALAFDIQAIKAMGFNTIRKHIKVEPERWYYHCDRLGIIVWQDFVNPPHDLPAGSKEEFEKEVAATMEQLHNHPSITTWVLFNEKWGSYDQKRLTQWVKRTDPSRLVNGHSGEILYVNDQLRSPSPNPWISADMTDIHAYPDPMNAPVQEGKACILGEFGGIGVFIPGHQWNPLNAWGYIQVTPQGLYGKYTVMNQHLKLLEREGLSGSIYTQPIDVEGEQNGLMTYDREMIKIPFEELRRIHSLLFADTIAAPPVSAKVADVTDPAVQYSRLLQQYLDGRREPGFLRDLAMMAQQSGDKAGVARISKEYIATIRPPYSGEELDFVLQNTNKVTDQGFAILQAQLKDSSSSLEKRVVSIKLMNTIYMDLMDPLLRDPQADVDWGKLEQRVKTLGSPGDEILLRAKAIYYLNKKDWNNYAPAAKIYLEKYGTYLSETEKKMFLEAIEKASKI